MTLDHATGKWTENTEEQGYYEVKTWWQSFEDFANWTMSDSFAKAHSNRPPKEMFAGPSKLEIHELFLSTDLDPNGDGDGDGDGET
jgi:heme-degrading monooxygenase HmoA